MTADDAAWLQGLNAEIWKHIPGTATSYGYSTATRLLKKKELKRIFSLAAECPVTLHNACMGFGVGMALWAHPQAPGIDELDMLIEITNEHLAPVEEYEKRHVGHAQFKTGWGVFSPIAKSPDNARWLKMYGIEPVRDEAHYAY